MMKSQKRRNQGLFLLDDGRIRIREAQTLTDLDPEHCIKQISELAENPSRHL
jgi:hypothetical protein